MFSVLIFLGVTKLADPKSSKGQSFNNLDRLLSKTRPESEEEGSNFEFIMLQMNYSTVSRTGGRSKMILTSEVPSRGLQSRL